MEVLEFLKVLKVLEFLKVIGDEMAMQAVWYRKVVKKEDGGERGGERGEERGEKRERRVERGERSEERVHIDQNKYIYVFFLTFFVHSH